MLKLIESEIIFISYIVDIQHLSIFIRFLYWFKPAIRVGNYKMNSKNLTRCVMSSD